jgi:hypothetical protein
MITRIVDDEAGHPPVGATSTSTTGAASDWYHWSHQHHSWGRAPDGIFRAAGGLFRGQA